MGNRASGGHRNRFVKKRSRAANVVALCGRIAVAAVGLLVLVLAGVQFARVIGQNMALARELAAANADVRQLEVRREQQLHQIRRLEDPQGAIPEIHQRLRLVKPNEEIIFVSPMPSPTPTNTP
jgi:cell division protein FtsB